MIIIFFATSICSGGKTDLKYDLSDPLEPWRGANSGVSTRIVPPYVALTRNGRTLSCWGRSYELGALFPVAVSSQSQKLLAGPITLRIKLKDKWITIAGLYPSFGSETTDRIEFSSKLTFEPLRVIGNGWIEYDGLIRCDIRLESQHAIRIERMELTFPFNPKASIFYHVERLWGPHIYERSPMQPGRKASYSWHPLIWVGNHDIGFTVVTETPYGWTSASRAIEFERLTDSLTLTLNIITKSTSLNGERNYTFGLQATPVKEMRADRWATIVGTLPGENVCTKFPESRFQPLFSYPQPNDFEGLAAYISNIHKQGKKFCYYITTSATSEKSQVNRRHHTEWLMSASLLKKGNEQEAKGLIGPEACCPASSFSNFMAWAVEKLMDTFDVDGVYIDNPGPYTCLNTYHGCGAGGMPRYPYFALRDLHKRIYSIVKAKKPDGFVWEHTSQRFNSLQMSWVDIYSGGEHFRNTKFSREQLYKMIDRTYLDITATGYQMGAIPAFLSSLAVRKDRANGEWSHWLLSRLLPFGQMIWAHHGWMDAAAAMAVARARAEFGLGKEPVDFYRPHELPEWFVISSPKPVIACLWQRKRDKALMAVVANWNDTAVLARISSQSIIGCLGPVRVSDSLTQVTIPANLIMISIPANSFRVITICPEEQQCIIERLGDSGK